MYSITDYVRLWQEGQRFSHFIALGLFGRHILISSAIVSLIDAKQHAMFLSNRIDSFLL